jgi:hypothetical protein
VRIADVVDRLAAVAGRGACTDAERRAAVALAGELEAEGHEARTTTHWVRPHWAVAVALGALLGAAGSLVAVAAPVPGLIAAAVAALSLGLEAAGITSPLRLLTPRRATQHVVSPPQEHDGVALLVCAPYDAPRRGLLLNDRWRALGSRLRNVRAWLALCALVIAGACALRLADTDGLWLGLVQLVPTVVLIVALAAALDVALSEFSPGADHASAAAVALAVHDELERDAPASLAPGLILYGAGASGPEALRRELRGADARRTVLLDIAPCTGGTPAWATGHAQLRRAAELAAGALELPSARRRPGRPRGVRGVPAVRVGCLDERGIAPRSHQPDDTAEHADLAAATAALDLALGIADALDAELARRAPAAAAR